ncbi:LysR substrate-binding domain-containing protein [Planosporangium mesophilum]|uniref:LysR family transcriptional regulator n=1 Tax=Planosporangium mesophilum TaxID=689768 RepID=A0A8J3TGK4_9ACTN|nr:LysR substrate-binding domain-containing protein [Planosporangium mesophilum]NJC85770.1 LysR family transcriptional regulator [Planosporangium mesophilum]GII24762.1 LysR family transcriptional regulator [Planosporangium mesophilum]
MTFPRLRAFVEVADSGSVREAARRLVVTESAVSAAVAALSRDVGVALVERDGRGLRLTPSGRVYARYARQMLGLLDRAGAAARGELDPERGEVAVGAVTTAADHLLPDLLASFRTAHPGIQIRLSVGASDHVWTLLRDHAVDLTIAGRPPAGLDARVRAALPNELVVVEAGGTGAQADLAGRTWLLREPGSGTRSTCESLLAGLEIDPPRLVLGSNGAVVAGAVAGLGLTLVSRAAVERELAEGRLAVVPVPGTPLRRPWHAASVEHASGPTLLLVDHLLQRGWRRPRTRSS